MCTVPVIKRSISLPFFRNCIGLLLFFYLWGANFNMIAYCEGGELLFGLYNNQKKEKFHDENRTRGCVFGNGACIPNNCLYEHCWANIDSDVSLSALFCFQ